MKKIFLNVLVVALFAISLFTVRAWSAPQTFEGVISDSMCGRAHMMPGKTDAQCVQECVKAGSKYVLVTGAKTYTLNRKAQQLAPFVGKKVRIQGELNGNTLSVQTIR